ncbi:unnamed protein product [Toxocara canis]|uniref:SERPIN domain-containing protein n=1 Tax=Toxocara canis TaxID=6265 RepID=A0A183UZU3_TOXCA|nr:unnamed protein product [Toxocara canis]
MSAHFSCGSSSLSAVDVAQADFAISLLRSSSDERTSTVMSPFSVAMALVLPYIGANGTTYNQMKQLLARNASDTAIEDYFGSSVNELSEHNFEFIYANKLYVKSGLMIRARFMDAVRAKYFGNIQQVDFGQPETLAKEVNDWVEQKAHAKICSLVSAKMFSKGSLMVIVNAVYFKAKWKNAFLEEDTQKRIFHENENRQREVDMMIKNGGFAYFEDNEIQLIGLAYDGGEAIMYAFLPKQKFELAMFEQSLHGTHLLELIHNCSSRVAHVELPKFRVEAEFELSNALQQMGLKDAFTNAADFSGITASKLFISKVVHKTFIKVNENGTEAAAGTALRLFGDRLQAPRINFIADHPFLFVIMKRDRILFIGRFR